MADKALCSKCAKEQGLMGENWMYFSVHYNKCTECGTHGFVAVILKEKK